MIKLAPEIFIPFAEQLATISGEIIRRYYRKFYDSEQKKDASPVTAVDREVEKNLRALIRNTYPDHGIIGEEYDAVNPEAEYKWLLDPIDGTKSFMMGRPIFGTLIALIKGKTPLLGIIDQPVLGERWTGVKGFATNFNYEPTKTRKCSSLSLATLCTTSPDMFKGKDKTKFERLKKAVKFTAYGGDCYSYGLISRGLLDIVIEADLKPHDFCALVPVIEGSHGIITDWEGNKINLNSKGHVVACGDKKLHAQLLKLLNDN